jgi:hypothetical protein
MKNISMLLFGCLPAVLNRPEEIDALKRIHRFGSYLINISPDLSIEDYIRIKELTQTLRLYRGRHVRTELRPDGVQ